MEITLKTKYDINDIVYGFHNGHVFKFKVKDLTATYSRIRGWSVSYDVIAVMGENGGHCFNEKMEEHQLHTREEVIDELDAATALVP